MLKYLKKHWLGSILLTLLAIVLYFVIGAVVPFVHYKKVTDKTKQNCTILSDVYENTTDVDRAQLLETNASAWEERIRLLNMAKDRIILSTFDMREGKSTTDLAAMIYKKAEEGVKVSILVDGMNGQLRMNENDFFYALSTHKNIEIRFYNPINMLMPWKSQGRMHDKYLIIDDAYYILGGRNTFDYFIGDYPARGKSYDREVLIYNTKQGTESRTSSLYQVEAYFQSVWESNLVETFGKDTKVMERETIEEQRQNLVDHYKKLRQDKPAYFEAYDYMEYTEPTKSVTLISGDIGIYGKEPKVLYELQQLMENAKDKVMIHTPYAVCNSYMYEVLTSVSEAVPHVTMMVNSIENGDNFFASSDYRINKKKVIETGITLLEYDGGTSYHGKSIVIDDDLSIVGSFNYDLRSVYMDTELMVVINSEELNRNLTRNLTELEKDCRKVISPTEYEVPEHVTVAEIPQKKQVAMWIVGWACQLVRYLL